MNDQLNELAKVKRHLNKPLQEAAEALILKSNNGEILSDYETGLIPDLIKTAKRKATNT